MDYYKVCVIYAFIITACALASYARMMIRVRREEKERARKRSEYMYSPCWRNR